MMQKPACEDCEMTFEAYADDPPCGGEPDRDWKKCEWFNPPLLSENIPVYEIYKNVINQHILGPRVVEKQLIYMPVALNLNAVYRMMKMKNIDRDERDWCNELIQSAFLESQQ